MHIHQRLYGASSVDPRQVRIGKRQCFFRCAGCYDQALGFDLVKNALIFSRYNAVFLINPQRRTAAPHFNTRLFRHFRQEALRNGYASFPGELFFRTEKFVSLLNQLPSQMTGTL